MSIALSTDMDDPTAIPYFLWDEPMTVSEFSGRLSDALDDGFAVASEIARGLGGTLESIHTAPDFRRLLLRRHGEAVLIDLVRDRVPQIAPQKLTVLGITVDRSEGILAMFGWPGTPATALTRLPTGPM